MEIKTPKKGSLIKRVMTFFGLPLLFCFIAYLIVFFIANPIIAPISSVLSMFIGDSTPNFNREEVADNIIEFVDWNAEQQPKIHITEITMPKMGEKYAHIIIPDTGVDCDVYYGDSKSILKKGPGQYNYSKLPGFGSTTLVAAHVTTHFNGLQNVEIGDTIYYATSWGAYEYKVTDIQIVKATEAEKLFDLRADHDNLVLYTCYPFHAVAFRSERFFVMADYVSGPKIDVSAK